MMTDGVQVSWRRAFAAAAALIASVAAWAGNPSAEELKAAVTRHLTAMRTMSGQVTITDSNFSRGTSSEGQGRFVVDGPRRYCAFNYSNSFWFEYAYDGACASALWPDDDPELPEAVRRRGKATPMGHPDAAPADFLYILYGQPLNAFQFFDSDTEHGFKEPMIGVTEIWKISVDPVRTPENLVRAAIVAAPARPGYSSTAFYFDPASDFALVAREDKESDRLTVTQVVQHQRVGSAMVPSRLRLSLYESDRSELRQTAERELIYNNLKIVDSFPDAALQIQFPVAVQHGAYSLPLRPEPMDAPSPSAAGPLGSLSSELGVAASAIEGDDELLLRWRYEVSQMLPVIASTSFLEVTKLTMSERRGAPHVTILYKFETRDVEHVRFLAKLLDDSGNTVEELENIVELGPEEVEPIAIGQALDNSWSRQRSTGFEFSKSGWNANVLEVTIAKQE